MVFIAEPNQSLVQDQVLVAFLFDIQFPQADIFPGSIDSYKHVNLCKILNEKIFISIRLVTDLNWQKIFCVQ